MPKWMAAMHQKLLNQETPQNIAVFLLKVIINRPRIFEPFASVWFRPIVEWILSPFMTSTTHKAGEFAASFIPSFPSN